MSNERIESLQSNMQFSPPSLPKIVLQRVEEEFPIWRKIIVSAMCRPKNYLILRICLAQTAKCFLGILCYLSFSVVSYFKDGFLLSLGLNAYRSFSSISMIISFMVVMIGYVRERRLMYQFAVPTLEDFMKVNLALTLYDIRSRYVRG